MPQETSSRVFSQKRRIGCLQKYFYTCRTVFLVVTSCHQIGFPAEVQPGQQQLFQLYRTIVCVMQKRVTLMLMVLIGKIVILMNIPNVYVLGADISVTGRKWL